MKKTINIFLIIFSLVLFQNCDEDQFEPELDYVTFGAETYSTGVDVSGTNDFNVAIFTSENVSSDTTFGLMVDESTDADPGSYVVPTSVTIPAGSNSGSFTVTLSDVNLGIGVNSLVIGFDGVTATAASGATTIEYTQNCNEVTATLDLTFDRWADEVSWEILDSEGGLVAESDAYPRTGAGTSTTLSIDITLCAGRSYTLVTTDAFGDGWGSVGSYTLTIGGTEKVSGDGSLMDNGGNGAQSSSADFDTL